jgi:hypothetical protein
MTKHLNRHENIVKFDSNVTDARKCQSDKQKSQSNLNDARTNNATQAKVPECTFVNLAGNGCK